MKHYIILLLAAIGIIPAALGDDNDVLFRIDGDPVTVGEFDYIYNKNNFNNKADYSEESLREYLELYINFRLKVREAEALGLDDDPKLQSELRVYQEQLYNSFFDREKLKVLVDEAIERGNWDVSISHIYVGTNADMPENSDSPQRAKITEAYKALESGQSFEEVARTYSEDKFTKDVGGYLNYYTVLQIAYYELENAAYETPVGSYSKPIRTPLGYHIVKVNDKRPARGLVKAAVIKMNKKNGDAGNAVIANIEKIYKELKEGADFSVYAAKYSEDRATKERGGEMDWFGIAKYDSRFEDAVFSLENVGDISAPFATDDAWYIVKLLGKKGTATDEEDRDLLTKKIKQSDRYRIIYQRHIEGILDKYGFEVDNDALQAFREAYIGNPDNIAQFLEGAEDDPVIATIAEKAYHRSEFGKYIQENAFRYRRMNADERYDKLFDDYRSAMAIDFHILEYGNENRDYGALLNEYRDGILLFELMENNVWSRAVQDTTGLRRFFDNNRELFMNPEAADVRVFKTIDSKQADFLAKALESDPDLTSVSWLSKLTKKGISTDYQTLKVLKTDALADQLTWGRSVNTIEDDGTWKVYQVMEILPPSPRSFSDSKGFAIAEYQEFLEAEWIKALREKYNVVVDEAVLKSMVQ